MIRSECDKTVEDDDKLKTELVGKLMEGNRNLMREFLNRRGGGQQEQQDQQADQTTLKLNQRISEQAQQEPMKHSISYQQQQSPGQQSPAATVSRATIMDSKLRLSPIEPAASTPPAQQGQQGQQGGGSGEYHHIESYEISSPRVASLNFNRETHTQNHPQDDDQTEPQQLEEHQEFQGSNNHNNHNNYKNHNNLKVFFFF